MASPFVGIDGVDVRNDIFSVGTVVVHRHLHRHLLVDGFDINRSFDDFFASFIQILHEFNKTSFGEKLIRLGHSLFDLTKVLQVNANTRIQKRHLTETVRYGFVFELGDGKNAIIRFEMDCSASLICFPNLASRVLRGTNFKFLFSDDPVSVDRRFEVCRKGVDAGNTDTVKTSRNLIGILVKLTTGMQYRQYYFEG